MEEGEGGLMVMVMVGLFGWLGELLGRGKREEGKRCLFSVLERVSLGFTGP